MIWGQSAGASAVDYHHYAYWDDPIAHAFFAQSGNVLYGGGSADWDHTNFTFVAKYVGELLETAWKCLLIDVEQERGL